MVSWRVFFSGGHRSRWTKGPTTTYRLWSGVGGDRNTSSINGQGDGCAHGRLIDYECYRIVFVSLLSVSAYLNIELQRVRYVCPMQKVVEFVRE